ncbi:uncharacterized protein N7483_010011 [Penicillium malachiteum]|uniref:uncharacterized protein n=1 Tax=Penicillium malachiteum TaxID=1324776 RepID=UPI00254780E0|nr:uncharacterized protein N7483_010011 [Penicillium malachiteum]KAJ5718929.1 hypothetical protein N7483_010011 [Penicillium malachiteum]
MGTRGLDIVRYRGRYYARYHQFDSYYESLGKNVVASIPADPEKYQKWLEKMRAFYEQLEKQLDKDVYEIRDGEKPNKEAFMDLESIPTEIPRLNNIFIEYIYVIDLDQEVLTMNHSIHWKLNNIPRDDLWMKAIKNSIYYGEHTVSPDICPEEHLASVALELPEAKWEFEYDFRMVNPRTSINEPRKVFLTQVLASILSEYELELIQLGRRWAPDSFPFRELIFAIVSIASGASKFSCLPKQKCHPLKCYRWECKNRHIPRNGGWLDEEWAGESAPWLIFSSACHRPGEPAGASPVETMYWLGNVVVNLTLVVDGDAIMKAAKWGIGQGRTHFQVVVISLFDVAFAEVLLGNDKKPFLKVSDAINLWPLRPEYSQCTHPRERPEAKPGMKVHDRYRQFRVRAGERGTPEQLRSLFPGLIALVNFFEVAGNRAAAASTTGVFPVELYARVMDFVDYDTWKASLLASPMTRAPCLRRYKLDDLMTIVGGPFVRLQDAYTGRRRERIRILSFDFEDTQTGEILPLACYLNTNDERSIQEWTWMPLIGSNRKALMADVTIQFQPVLEIPLEDEGSDNIEASDDEGSDSRSYVFSRDQDENDENEMAPVLWRDEVDQNDNDNEDEDENENEDDNNSSTENNHEANENDNDDNLAALTSDVRM